jgi:hypothetical protein
MDVIANSGGVKIELKKLAVLIQFSIGALKLNLNLIK